MKKVSSTPDNTREDYAILAVITGLPALLAGLASGIATDSALVGTAVGVFFLGTYGTAIAIPALRKN